MKIVTKFLKFILKFNWISLGLIPVVLCVVWVGLFLNFLEKRNEGFLVLTQRHNTKELTSYNYNEIHSGEKISGSFKASEDRLGIVAVRFNTFYRINDDVLLFRIKESNAINWYYENTYKVDQFQPHQFFTFGFPIVEESQGKYYSFEIESTKGSPENAVALSEIQPSFLSKYQQSKVVVTENPVNLTVFLIKKTLNSFQDIELFFTFLIYSYPLFFYVIWYLFIRKYLKNYLSQHYRKFNYAIMFTGLIVFGVIIDTLIIKSVNSILMFILVSLWLITSRVLKLSSDFTLLLALTVLAIAVTTVIMDIAVIPYKSYRWVYILFMVGYLQKLIEFKTQPKSLITLKTITDFLIYRKRK